MGRLATGQGGKGSNQAIACGRTGVPTLFVGALGDDGYASNVEAFYRREKIGCTLAIKPNTATGTAVILIDSTGQNQIVIEPGANGLLSPEDVPTPVWGEVRVLMTQLEANLATTVSVLRAARSAGITTILNPAPMRSDFDFSLLENVDILIPNEHEFVALVRLRPEFNYPDFTERNLHALTEENLHLLCRRFAVPTLIITLGSKGCFVSERDTYRFIPAYDNIEVVDTTGAGDAFCGGFASGLIQYKGDCVAAARFGSAVAALSITKPGAAGAMPSLEEIEDFRERRGGVGI